MEHDERGRPAGQRHPGRLARRSEPDARRAGGPGARLAAVRVEGARFKREFATTGTSDSITTCDLVTLPYPTRSGLFRASRAIAPFLSITTRMLVIRWHETDGRARVLLFEPSDAQLGRYTPYFDSLGRRTPAASPD